MIGRPEDAVTLLDTDTLSLLARGHERVVERASRYLRAHGRLTMSAITVFERLRGYRSALERGRPYELPMRRFVALARQSHVVAIDDAVADHAAQIWARVGARARGQLVDLLVIASASAHGMPVATRNHADFQHFAAVAPSPVVLLDWTKA